jgi:hypothetical protein
MIKTIGELDFTDSQISCMITGIPGIGKTTMALSAPSPVLIDIEGGAKRAEACYLCDTTVFSKGMTPSEKYDSILADIDSIDPAKYKTVIVDSIGALALLLYPVLIERNPKYGQANGNLSLQGFGALSSEISLFIQKVKAKGLDVIFISHVTEKEDKDTNVIKTRLDIPGSTRDNIWNDIDLGGFMEIQGKDRVISFTSTDRYFAKGGHGVKGVYKVPALADSKSGGRKEDNHFMADLFSLYKSNIKDDLAKYSDDSRKYSQAMLLAPEVSAAKDAGSLNAAVEKIKKAEHALTSKRELGALVAQKAKELGLAYDSGTKAYVVLAK